MKNLFTKLKQIKNIYFIIPGILIIFTFAFLFLNLKNQEPDLRFYCYPLIYNKYLTRDGYFFDIDKPLSARVLTTKKPLENVFVYKGKGINNKGNYSIVENTFANDMLKNRTYCKDKTTNKEYVEPYFIAIKVHGWDMEDTSK